MTQRAPIEPIAKKVYYSIGEVCDLTGLKPHVLRYWETQFDVLNPRRTARATASTGRRTSSWCSS
jgi:DNA-binding transcriptional MerR regulator